MSATSIYSCQHSSQSSHSPTFSFKNPKCDVFFFKVAQISCRHQHALFYQSVKSVNFLLHCRVFKKIFYEVFTIQETHEVFFALKSVHFVKHYFMFSPIYLWNKLTFSCSSQLNKIKKPNH